MSNHLFGVHWAPLHRAGTDKATFAKWRPPFVKLVWDGSQPPYLEDIPAEAKIVWRNYPLSEQFHGGLDLGVATPRDIQPAFLERLAMADGLPQNGSGRDLHALPQVLQMAESTAALPTPEAAAAAYLKNAEEVIAYCESRGVSRKRLVFEGPNEYPVWVYGYTGLARLELARLRGLHKLGTGGCYSNLGVGWPGNLGKDLPPVWDWFAAVAAEFGDDDYLGYHSYWGRNGITENWGWWAGRILKCPFKVKFLGTEVGIDLGVYGAGSAKQGWLNCWPGASQDQKAANYIAELGQYEDAMRKDGRAAGLLPYTYDGNRDDWGMFSIDMAAFLNPWLPWLASRPPLTAQPSTPSDPYLAALQKAFGAKLKDERASLPHHATLTYARRSVGQISRLIYHHTAGASSIPWANIARYHINSNGWPGIAYHVGVDPDGTVHLLNDLETISYHAGNANSDSVGVCLGGNYELEQPTNAAVAALLAYADALDALLGRKVTRVGHRQVSQTACPGKHLFARLSQTATPDKVAAAMLAAGEIGEVINLSAPRAALVKAIIAAGRIPTGPEFSRSVDGATYIGQPARGANEANLTVYYVRAGEWDAVKSVAEQ